MPASAATYLYVSQSRIPTAGGGAAGSPENRDAVPNVAEPAERPLRWPAFRSRSRRGRATAAVTSSAGFSRAFRRATDLRHFRSDASA